MLMVRAIPTDAVQRRSSALFRLPPPPVLPFEGQGCSLGTRCSFTSNAAPGDAGVWDLYEPAGAGVVLSLRSGQ